jgi:hypothetical protein
MLVSSTAVAEGQMVTRVTRFLGSQLLHPNFKHAPHFFHIPIAIVNCDGHFRLSVRKLIYEFLAFDPQLFRNSSSDRSAQLARRPP